MKKILMFLFAMFICAGAIAHTINWYANGQVVSTTSCQSGDNITPPTAPAKTGYHFVRWESGYTKLEYIESTGTQYIDTGVILDKLASEVFINFKKTNGANDVSLMGCQDTSASYNLRQTYYYYGSGVLSFYNSTSSSYSNLGEVANNVKHTIHTIVDNNNNVTLNIDGVTKTFTQQSGISDNRLKLYLFANNSNVSAIQKVSAQMYSVWIRNSSGTLVFNGIPARRQFDNVVGMYDTVSGQFFTNAGTGTFVAGPEIGDLQ